jgi:prepilin-type N-terminal cleavage/methylation domain-containing protein
MLLYNVHRKSNKGFTLVEMIVTVIIVGVIASIAAPNLLGLLNQSRVKDG